MLIASMLSTDFDDYNLVTYHLLLVASLEQGSDKKWSMCCLNVDFETSIFYIDS
jgi:hypothetical protein